MNQADELRLIKAAQSGDSSAFEELVRDNQKLVYNLALKLSGNPDDALDISQNVFIKAYTNLGSFRGDSRFSVWLYRLCHNASMDFLRQNKSSRVVSIHGDDGDDEQQKYDAPDPGPLPSEIIERRELRQAVRDAIMSLPENKRDIIIMAEFSHMSYSDIAWELGISEGTVKSRLSRARASLAEILRENGTFSTYAASKGWKGGKQDE